MFSEKISAPTGSGNEMVGLATELIRRRKKVKSLRLSRFSRTKLEVGRNRLGLCIAIDEPKKLLFSRPS